MKRFRVNGYGIIFRLLAHFREDIFLCNRAQKILSIEVSM